MRLDGKIELVAGACSSNPQKSKLSGEDLLWVGALGSGDRCDERRVTGKNGRSGHCERPSELIRTS